MKRILPLISTLWLILTVFAIQASIPPNCMQEMLRAASYPKATEVIGYLSDRTYIEVAADSKSGTNIIVTLTTNAIIPTIIDWGDGTSSTNYGIHDYATNTTNILTIRGGASHFNFYNDVVTRSMPRRILTPIQGLTNLTDLYRAFYSNTNLISITSNLFVNCTNVTIVNRIFGDTAITNQATVSSLIKCQDFDRIYYFCPALQGSIVSFTGLSNAIDLSEMYVNCSGLTSIPTNAFVGCTDIDSFYGTFAQCTNIYGSIPDLTTCTNVTTIEAMFHSCYNITSCPTNNFLNMTKLNDVGASDYYGDYSPFMGMINFTSPAPSFANSTLVTDWGNIFRGMWKMPSLPANLFGTNNATSFYNAFRDCRTLSELPDGIFSGCTNAQRFDQLCYGATNLSTIPQSLFDNCPNVTTFQSAFRDTILTNIPNGIFASNSLVTDASYTFMNTKIKDIPTNIFTNMLLVTTFNATFSGCTNLTSSIPSLVVNTNVTTMRYMFYNCPELTNGFSTHFEENTKVTNYEKTFYRCYGLTNDLSAWTWRTNIEIADFQETRFDYTTSPGALSTNVKNDLVFNMYNCLLTSNEVSNILIDLDASGASNGICNVSGNNQAPTEIGYTAKTNLVGKSWTISTQ